MFDPHHVLGTAADGQVRERRNQLPRPAKPELLATGPNQCWSWDISKLRGPVKWSYFYQYVLIDIFSRYVAGWMVADRDSQLAKALIGEALAKQCDPKHPVIHADRGTSMTSQAAGTSAG